MHRRKYAHRCAVRVFVGNALVHLEEVAVSLRDRGPAQSLDSLGEVEIHAIAARTHSASGVTYVLDRPRGDVTGHEVSETRVRPLQEIVAFRLGDARGWTDIACFGRYPDPAVIAQRLTHQGQLGLPIGAAWNAGRVYLGECRVGKIRAPPVRPPDRGRIAADRIRRQIKRIAVTAGGQHDGIGHEAADLAGDQVAGDNAAGPPVEDNEVEHFGTRVHLDIAGID